MDFQKAVDLINKSGSVLITTHTRPDGDACGAVAAMYDVLTALDKKVRLVLLSEIPEWYEFLFVENPPIPGGDITVQQLKESKDAQPDLIIIVDTNSKNQLPEFAEYLKQNDKPVLVIDHHVTSDGIGDVELIDSTAAAVSLIVLDFLKYAKWEITPKIAQALFVGVATDTGWFQFNNTDSRVHRSCADIEGNSARRDNPAEGIVNQNELVADRIRISQRADRHALAKQRLELGDNVGVLFFYADDTLGCTGKSHRSSEPGENLAGEVAENLFILMQQRLALSGVEDDGIDTPRELDVRWETSPACTYYPGG